MRLLDPDTQTDAIEQAAQRLADGGLLALPTETVYGLGARADDDAAVARIFEAKGRPSNHPLIVHVANAEAAWQFAAAVPLVAQQLMDRFWPGPLTVIVPRAPGMAAASAGGQDTIGLRCPDHPVALKLLQAAARLGVMGVAAPSANRFGRISPTRAEHVIDEFQDQGSGLDEVWVLQGGLCDVGIESTIVDCTRAHPVILRPGRLTRDEIEAAAGEPVALSTPESRDAGAPRASGTLAAHYAPRAKLRLMSDLQLSSALDLIEPELTAKALANKAVTPPGIAVYSRSLWAHRPASPGVVQRAMPADAISAAHHLFSDLRELDALGVELIWVEKPPVDAVWDGVRDRLARASAA
ncbi:L-threonylcarbamoyladenylate synthase [Aquabacterium sp.]|uniref:L-threonylcarbamoyladenylate synthase n=1 Tax=Aquabacterium sp. TaxID=1872578 RepID=UPI0019CAF066|nr:L-threonylcarbamoyladenylate synthase [Aquabacterium sp.]MBC7699043.1 threonylcarbamoyl-AMP synthase [Aquabacterium sp.]